MKPDEMQPLDVPRLIAFYLPQFHPIPENDRWWGKGFTEWTNVTKARPQFPGHYQPHLPADLGFYDLRLPEARQAQADLAREYGIYGFCYYHYWFNGKRLLERPFNEVLASGKPDLPFCLCWANENWTRRWDGQDRETLMEQTYNDEDHRHHIHALLPAFRDNRYIRVDGRPLFLVYWSDHIPDPLRMNTIWREEARRAGLGELFLCRVESHGVSRTDPTPLGYDAAVEFQPDYPNLGFTASKASHRVYDYPAVVQRMLGRPEVSYRRFPCVTPSWDNSARRKENALILRGSTPDHYRRWLEQVLADEAQRPRGDGFVFINAWNEWAEGNHLEPCRKWGRGYLEATRDALAGVRTASSIPPRDVGAPGHADADLAALQSALDAAKATAAEILDSVRAELVRASSGIQAVNDETGFLEQLRDTVQDIITLVPSGRSFILVDQETCGFATSVAGRRRIPFTERDGRYWGPPADDETAVRELERLRAAGADFIAFAWPAFWWLDHYRGLHTYLQTRFTRTGANERLVVFDLTPPPATAADAAAAPVHAGPGSARAPYTAAETHHGEGNE